MRECLLDPDVEAVTALGRASVEKSDPKLVDLVHKDLFDLSSIEEKLAGFDACFFCLGVSSAGMKEADYKHITLDLTLSVAKTLVRLNPEMTFLYVSGAHTDSTEKGSSMWARVKGATENALLELPFKAAYMLRPGAIQPLHGIRSKTPLYRAVYAVGTPLFWFLRTVAPRLVTTTEELGRAMIFVAKNGVPKRILETEDITAIGRGQPPSNAS